MSENRPWLAHYDPDVPATLEPIEQLDKSSTAHDPWWQYHLAAGRDADDILRDMWSKVAKF